MKNKLDNLKWHYFNHLNAQCRFKTGNKLYLFTLCGRLLRDHYHHTEFKSRVTCRRCLQRIVGQDKQLTKKEKDL